MKPNVGMADRVIRIVVGFAVLSLFFILEGNARWLGLLGLLSLVTGLLGWCAFYVPFGIDTARTARHTPDAAHPSRS